MSSRIPRKMGALPVGPFEHLESISLQEMENPSNLSDQSTSVE
jgi:hypothetical protein